MKPPCQHCTGACCRDRGQGWKYATIRDDGTRVPYDSKGDCIYLRGNDCSLYGTDAMPTLCRTFDCRTRESFLDAREDVRVMLAVHGKDVA